MAEALPNPAASLQACLEHKDVSKLPSFAVKAANEAYKSLKAIEKQCQECVKGVGTLTYTLEDVTQAVSTAGDQEKFLKSMLNVQSVVGKAMIVA